MPLIAMPQPLLVTLWIRNLGTDDDADRWQDIARDSSGNLYLCGYLDADVDNEDDNFMIAKYDSTGSLVFTTGIKHQFDPDNDEDYGRGVAGTDTDGNFYVCGKLNDETHFYLSKHNGTTGTQIWERSIQNGGGGNYTEARSVDVRNDLVYVTGGMKNAFGASSANIFTICYNKAGTEQWRAQLGDPIEVNGNSNEGMGVIADGSNNAYVVGTDNESWAVTIVVEKYNSSGVEQWRVGLGETQPTNGYVYATDIAIDSGGNNVFVTGYQDTSSGGGADFNGVVAKLATSNGAVQWQRRLGVGDGDDLFILGVTVGSTGRVFVCGYETTASGKDDAVIMELDNSDGTIIWQRKFGAATPADEITYKLVTDNNGFLYMAGRSEEPVHTDGGSDGMLLRVPDDGSGIGPYGSGSEYSYASLSRAETAGNLGVGSATGLAVVTPSTSAGNSGTQYSPTLQEIVVV